MLLGVITLSKDEAVHDMDPRQEDMLTSFKITTKK
jgi:hypothetical protein